MDLARDTGHCTRLHHPSYISEARNFSRLLSAARDGTGVKDSVMFARQLYKQATITPSSCRKFRYPVVCDVVPLRISRARSELPGARTTWTMSCAVAVIIYCILRTTGLQFSCPIRSETHWIIQIYLIPRAIALSALRFCTDSHLIAFIAFNTNRV